GPTEVRIAAGPPDDPIGRSDPQPLQLRPGASAGRPANGPRARRARQRNPPRLVDGVRLRVLEAVRVEDSSESIRASSQSSGDKRPLVDALRWHATLVRR